MHSLPPELVVHILERLDQTDLRSVSAVSRLFYHSAWSAGRYRHCTISWDYTAARAGGHEIVAHARKTGLRLNLTIRLEIAGGAEELRQAHFADAHARILALLDVALLVRDYLEVWVAQARLPSLIPALRHAAPQITSFRPCVRRHGHSGPLYSLPVGLFAGSAHKLRRLELLDVAFGSDQIPALALLHSVRVSYTEIFPYIDFGRHFPLLRNLDVRNFGGNTDVPPHPAAFKLDGVRLRRLFVQDYEPYTFMPTMMRVTNVAAIPNVIHTSDEINWADPFWQRKHDVPLSVRLARCVKEDGDINVRVALGVLRELRVDFAYPAYYPRAQDPVMEMVWPPDWLSRRDGFTSFDEETDRSGPVFATRSYSTIGCTALRQLTLALCDAGIALAFEEIAFLGRALSQCERPARDRAALVLAGTSMKTPVAQALLDQTFSAVRSDGNSLMERDA